MAALEKYIDHTLLKPTASPTAIKKLCAEAMEHQFYAVCVNGCHVQQAKAELRNSGVQLAAVIGFPLGANHTKTKIYEAEQCIQDGADEIDMVINVGWLKSNMDDQVRKEIKAIKNAIQTKVLKVILETCYLTDEEKVRACQLAMAAGADFVKTSTGFGSGGATYEDVKLMKGIVGDQVKIKASGGIKTKAMALKYIELGASRIGTSSGPLIIT